MHNRRSLAEPSRGDEIKLLNPLTGETGSFIAQVARTRSVDYDEGIWEVLDQYSRIRYIRASDEAGVWLEIEVDF